MTTKEPKGATMLAARLARAYPSLSAYSAASLAEELCDYVRLGRRRAKRVSRWLGGGGRLPSIGHTMDLERQLRLVAAGPRGASWELHGPTEEVRRVMLTLAEQERCERRKAGTP